MEKMISTRIARAGRSRFFIFIGVIILMVGFVAIFNSSQQQLDELRQDSLKCEQQQKTLSDQMKFVVETKLRLEKSLANARLTHDQFQQESQLKQKEEKQNYEKTLQETNNRYSSLKQNFKLLQSENDDLKTECASAKAKQLEENNDIQSIIKSLKGQVIQLERERDKEIEHWKVKYKQLETENKKLHSIINEKDANGSDMTHMHLETKIIQLEKLIDGYKSHCSYNPDTSNQQVEQPALQKKSAEVERSFDRQIPVSDDLYKIPIKLVNHTKVNSININSNIIYNKNNGSNSNKKIDDKMVNKNTNPNSENGGGIIINSVENFQIIQKQLKINQNTNSKKESNNNLKLNDNDMNVLQEPPGMLNLKSSTYSSLVVSYKKTSESNLNNKLLEPLAVAPIVTITPRNRMISSSTETKMLHKPKPIPVGVVPFQTIQNAYNNMAHENDLDSNRYMKHAAAASDTNVLENNSEHKNSLDNPNINKRDSEKNDFQNGNEMENGAHEINDNDFNIIDDVNVKNHRDHLQELLDDEKLNVNPNNQNMLLNNNAAEEDTNLYDNKNLDNDVDLEIIKKRKNENGGDKQLNHNSNNNNNNNDKLINEIVGDQGKVVEYPDDVREDLQLEQAGQDDDDDEYVIPAARKQDPAVRN